MRKIVIITLIILLSSSITLAQDFCKADFDYNGMVDANDVITFLNEFGRTPFHNPCPPDGPSPVPQTGQTTSYATGDDGDLERGVTLVSTRFTDNGDGTVTDNQTGLIWMKDANCFGQRTWNNALSDCNGLADGQCGLTDGSQVEDWRLANYKELISLVDVGNYNPALPIGHPFNNVQSYRYWPSSTFAHDTNYAWSVDMSVGFVGPIIKSNDSCYVWCVRGGH